MNISDQKVKDALAYGKTRHAALQRSVQTIQECLDSLPEGSDREPVEQFQRSFVEHQDKIIVAAKALREMPCESRVARLYRVAQP